MQQRKNQDLRDLIRQKGTFNYKVAEHLHISTPLFTVWLQRDLSPERRAQILQAIEDTAQPVSIDGR